MSNFSNDQIIGIGLIRGQKPRIKISNYETIEIPVNYNIKPIVPADNTYVAPIILR